MSANIKYHTDKLKATIEATFENGRETSLALTKVDEAYLWLTQAERRLDRNPYDERDEVENWFKSYARPISTTLGKAFSLDHYDELVKMARND